jgi:ribosomal protein S18 acetylase RimI-like enzyme
MFDSSFVTDKIFRIGHPGIDRLSNGIGFEISIREFKLDNPIHKYFPNDQSDDDDDDDDEGFTVVVEDAKSFSPIQPPDASTMTTSVTHDIIGFITVNFSAWNSRLIIADIEIHPSYRRQGIGGSLVRVAEKIARSRYHIRHVWLEVSNVNYPAVRSYLSMGFLVAGLDISLYTATEAEGEFAIFMWKRVG